MIKQMELRVLVRVAEEDKEQETVRPTRHLVMSEQSGSRDENTHPLTHSAAGHCSLSAKRSVKNKPWPQQSRDICKVQQGKRRNL